MSATRRCTKTNLSAQLHATVEVFAPDAPIQRVDAPSKSVLLCLSIPDPPDAHSLVLVRHEGEEAAPAVDVSVLKLPRPSMNSCGCRSLTRTRFNESC